MPLFATYEVTKLWFHHWLSGRRSSVSLHLPCWPNSRLPRGTKMHTKRRATSHGIIGLLPMAAMAALLTTWAWVVVGLLAIPIVVFICHLGIGGGEQNSFRDIAEKAAKHTRKPMTRKPMHKTNKKRRIFEIIRQPRQGSNSSQRSNSRRSSMQQRIGIGTTSRIRRRISSRISSSRSRSTTGRGIPISSPRKTFSDLVIAD